MKKSILQFEATIKTEATKELYRYTLNKFCEFAGIAYTEEQTVSKKRKDPKVIRHFDYDAILKMTDEQLGDKVTKTEIITETQELQKKNEF